MRPSPQYRTAIRLKPDYAEAHCNLGMILRVRGDYAGSLAMVRRGHELGTRQPGWSYPSAQWVADAERMAALAARLPAVLKGEDRPKDVAERLAIARMCYETKRFAAAARLWAEALAADPKLGDDRQAGHRYNAACAGRWPGAARGRTTRGPMTPRGPGCAARRSTGSRPSGPPGPRSWMRLVRRRAVHPADTRALAGRRRPGRRPRCGRPGRAARVRAHGLAVALGRGRCPAGAGRCPAAGDRPMTRPGHGNTSPGTTVTFR